MEARSYAEEYYNHEYQPPPSRIERERDARMSPSAGHILWFRDPMSGSLCELYETDNGLYRASYASCLEHGRRIGRWEGPIWQRAAIVARFGVCAEPARAEGGA